MFKLLIIFGAFKLLSVIEKIQRKFLILALVMINLYTISFVYNTVFSESGYQELLANNIRLEDAIANGSGEGALIFASGKIEGKSLLRDEQFGVESEGLVLVRKISEKYYETFECAGANSKGRRCGEYRWKRKSTHYEYSPTAKVQETGLSDKLLKELAIGTGTKRVDIASLDYDLLAQFDQRRPFIRNSSIYFSEDRSKERTGDLRVTFYQLNPKAVTFFAKMKAGQLVELEGDAIAKSIDNYDRVYANGVVSVNHFLNTSQSSLTTETLSTLGMAFVLLFFFIARYLNDFSNPQHIVLFTFVLAFINLLALSSPLLFMII